jgi:hypothetical protein
MSKKSKSEKRPIDRIRDGAGTIEIKTADDDSAITEMISCGDNLLVVKEKGIYTFKFADQIDPDRKNINTPNAIQKLLSYGSSDPWVGAVVLTGNELLKKETLREGIDTAQAMTLIIEIAQNISGAIEIKEGFDHSQIIELEKYDLKIKNDRSVILPSMRGVSNKCKEFLQKSDHALDALFKIVKIFFPNVGKGAWESLKKEVDKEQAPIDNFSVVLSQTVNFLQFVRSARNCAEHPRNGHNLLTTDFSIDTNNNLVAPSIEIAHPKTPQPPVPIVGFMNQIVDEIVDVVELMLAFLCNRNIRTIQGFPVSVYEFPEDKRRSKHVKYGYGVATEDSIIRFG